VEQRNWNIIVSINHLAFNIHQTKNAQKCDIHDILTGMEE
jgi:hypothetical protein